MADTTTTIPVYSTVEEYDNAARERTIQEGDLVKIVKNGKTHFVIHSRYDLNSKKGVLYRVGATQTGMN
jgi:DNA-directed RNA polymerase subunit H (RpoH/RPB5)